MNNKNSLQLAKMQNSSQETRDYAFKMEALKKNLMPPVDKEKKLREACQGFESIFIQKMWEQMRATIPESGFLKGREERFWQSMYDQELAKTMAGAGGIGLADMMYEQLSRNLRSVGKHTAAAVGGQPSGFAAEIAPAPLLAATGPAQTDTAAIGAEASAKQQKSSALTGLYSELQQPNAPPDAPRNAAASQDATQPASGAAGQPVAESETNPAILAVLNALRSAHARPANAPTNGQQGPGLSLGARPPLPPMQGDGHEPSPEHQGNTAYVSALTKPVHKPASGKRTLLPRAASGSRVPAGQPVHRNLPSSGQASLQAQTQNPMPANPAQPAPAASISGPASSGADATDTPKAGG